MSDRIDKIVDVTIIRQTQVPSEVSFSEFLVASEFLEADVTPAMTERVRIFGNLTAVGDAFGTSTTIYKMAQAAFLQNPSLSRIYVGRKLTGGDGSEDWSTALAAINSEDSSWYGLACGTRALVEQQEIADWVEANKKLCGLASDDANIVDGVGDIAEYINSNNYERSFVIYHPDSNATAAAPGTDSFPECAWIGKLFPADNIPGSSTWAHKTLAGVTAYTLTEAQYNTAIGKKCNLYQTIGGLSKTIFGQVGSGEFIDVVWGTDWLESHIQTLVYTPLAVLPKVPFTDDGIQAIVSQLRTALQDAVDSGLLAADPVPVVDFPLASEVSAQDKANRNLPNVTFVATLAGAIHTTVINGTLVL